MSKRRWFTAALVGAGLAGLMALVLGLAGWSWTERRIGEALCNLMIFAGLGMIGLAGLIANPLPTRAQPAAQPSSLG